MQSLLDHKNQNNPRNILLNNMFKKQRNLFKSLQLKNTKLNKIIISKRSPNRKRIIKNKNNMYLRSRLPDKMLSQRKQKNLRKKCNKKQNKLFKLFIFRKNKSNSRANNQHNKKCQNKKLK